MTSLFAIFGLGPMEIVVIVVLGVLLFGRKLPDMGRYLGKSITEFRKGMKGLEDDVENVGSAPMAQPGVQGEPMRPPQRVAATAPKFEETPAGNQPQV